MERIQGQAAFHQLESELQVQPVRVNRGAVPPGGDAVDLVGEAVFVFELAALAQQQPREGLADIAKADQDDAGMGHDCAPSSLY